VKSIACSSVFDPPGFYRRSRHDVENLSGIVQGPVGDGLVAGHDLTEGMIPETRGGVVRYFPA
jgi:hypothetical protein